MRCPLFPPRNSQSWSQPDSCCQNSQFRVVFSNGTLHAHAAAINYSIDCPPYPRLFPPRPDGDSLCSYSWPRTGCREDWSRKTRCVIETSQDIYSYNTVGTTAEYYTKHDFKAKTKTQIIRKRTSPQGLRVAVGRANNRTRIHICT